MPSHDLTESNVMPAAALQHPSPLSAAEEDALVRQHLPLVGYAVSDLCRRLPAHVSRDDLVSAGMAALAMAARGFQEERGVPFGRYASRRIQGALLDELRGHDWASRSVRRRAREQEEAADQLAARLGRPPTPAEVAADLGVAVDELAANERDVHRSVVLSFQAVIDVSGVDSVLPSSEPTPDQILLDRERDAYLRDAVATLPDRLRAVVVGVFFDERPMQELAVELDVTESRVSQMRTEALALLKDGMTATLAPESLPAEERPDGRVARRKQAYYAAIAAHSDFRARLSIPAARAATSSTVSQSA
jgi:RNA polymerase sigma factor for flagellar operon FliA